MSITLSDSTASGKLHRTLELLDGTRTLAAVEQESGISWSELETLVSHLEHYNAISPGPDNFLDYQVDLLRGTLSNLGERNECMPRVEILSDSSLGNELAEQICDSGDKPRVIDITDPLFCLLMREDFTLREDPLKALEDEQRYEEWRGRFLVAAFETINPILFRNLNRLSLRYSFAWIHAALDGPFILVGPTFLPGCSSCYECFEGRVASNIRENGSYLSYKKVLAEGKVKLGRSVIPRAIQSLLVSLTGFEVLNFVSTGSAFTIGKTLAIYLPTLEFTFNEVLRLPGCPGCSSMNEKNERTLYFSVKRFVNDLYSAEVGAT
ncbi:MAG: TOMM precursor leader peptide-binding protein [Candidatus Acidiferrales bacterium]